MAEITCPSIQLAGGRHSFPLDKLRNPTWILDPDKPGLVKASHTCTECGTVRTEWATMPRQRPGGGLTPSVRHGNYGYDWPEGYHDVDGRREEIDLDDLRAHQIAASMRHSSPNGRNKLTPAAVTASLRATRSKAKPTKSVRATKTVRARAS